MKANNLVKYADDNQKNLYKKFPTSHVLSNSKVVMNTLSWITFFRRNMHRCATDYLGIKLYPYQELMLYMLGITDLFNCVGSRSIAKSFIIALYSCCHCILYPKSEVVIASSTVKQAELIIARKIQIELLSLSPQLDKEIKEFRKYHNYLQVVFHNGSTITVVPALDSARGERSTVLIREENRLIAKKVDDNILSPFQHVRDVPFIHLPEYENIEVLKDEPKNIYITSSWFEEHEWMWNVADTAFEEMLQGKNQTLLAFDESVILKHGIKKRKQLKLEKKKIDSLTWRIEYLNERPKEKTGAYFTYSMLANRQVLKKPFYPRKDSDVRAHKKNPHYIPKQEGEIRVVSCDFAFCEGKKNDNSIFSCVRCLPESVTYNTGDRSVSMQNGYRRQYVHFTSINGGDVEFQALTVRRLYEDFDADYIVLDMRNAGIAVYQKLMKIIYDEARDIEYSPLGCMNKEDADVKVDSVSSNQAIFVISATQKLNSQIATCFRQSLESGVIDLLVGYNQATEEILPKMPEYETAIATGVDEQMAYESPFLETQELINETINLVYEKKTQTGIIVISEKGNNRKDRYTSASYANYFVSLLEQDMSTNANQYSYTTFIN